MSQDYRGCCQTLFRCMHTTNPYRYHLIKMRIELCFMLITILLQHILHDFLSHKDTVNVNDLTISGITLWNATTFMSNKPKRCSAPFRLECPMPIALCAPSSEYISCFALHLSFVRLMDWNMWKSVARSSWPMRGRASTVRCASDRPKSETVYGKFVYVRKLESNVDFLPNDDPYRHKTQQRSCT